MIASNGPPTKRNAAMNPGIIMFVIMIITPAYLPADSNVFSFKKIAGGAQSPARIPKTTIFASPTLNQFSSLFQP